ncbi:MAG TPA: methyl-accepting chemotaxis protein [Myxococcales bacterium]
MSDSPGLLERLRRALVEPSPEVTRADQRRNVRLLSTLLLLIGAFDLAAAAAEWAFAGLARHVVVELAAGVAFAGAYALSRTRHHRPAALGGMVVLAALPFAVYLGRGVSDPRAVFGAFPWVVIPCTAVGLFYSLRAGAGLLAASVAAMAIAPFAFPWVPRVETGLALAVVLFLTAANLLVLLHQRRLEEARIELLASTNLELAEVREENGRLLQQALETIQNLGSVAGDILVATRQQSQGAAEQSAAAAEAATGTEELDRLAQEAAQTAREVAQALQRAGELAEAGRANVSESGEALARLRDDVRSIVEHMRALAGHARRVGEIINAVEDFAAQSKILALNASIEAAAAGEAGAGFAVVAREIRTLAERSRQDTTQVRAILQEILRGTRTAAEATERGVASAEERIQKAGEVRDSIEQVVETVRGGAKQALTVADRGATQALGIGVISSVLKDMSATTAQGLSATKQVEAAAQLLTALAGSLEQTVEKYRS